MTWPSSSTRQSAWLRPLPLSTRTPVLPARVSPERVPSEFVVTLDDVPPPPRRCTTRQRCPSLVTIVVSPSRVVTALLLPVPLLLLDDALLLLLFCACASQAASASSSTRNGLPCMACSRLRDAGGDMRRR